MEPNIFCCPEVGISPFWKGVLWAAQAAHMGIKWVVGNGEKIRFWEDQWIGNTSLAIVFWPLYVINKQHGKTVCQVWDGQELKLSFRKDVSEALMNMWLELCSLVENTSLNNEEDQILWSYSTHGTYSVQSLYAVINCRGVFPRFVQAVWKLVIPPRVQFFLWLVSQNRVLTRDNLKKRRDVSDPMCLFCSEHESICHLFFYCCVAVNVWRILSEVLGLEIGGNYESVAKFWIANKKHLITNVVSSAVIWSIWKLRNEICFQGVVWTGFVSRVWFGRERRWCWFGLQECYEDGWCCTRRKMGSIWKG